MSLNPFTNKRKKQEDKVRDHMESQHADAQYVQEVQQQPPPPSSGGYKLPQNQDSYEAEDLNKYLPTTSQDEPSAAAGWSGGSGTAEYEPPSRARQCLGKIQSGFMVGGALGGAVGFLYGTYTAIKYKHVLYLPAAVIQAGAAFGFFLACGTVIRCDELPGADRRRDR
jgi:hypothetical protein